jgi:hypothetical protein
MVQKKIAYQYTTWCKTKLPISIQNGAKENCLQIYNMAQKMPNSIQNNAKEN